MDEFAIWLYLIFLALSVILQITFCFKARRLFVRVLPTALIALVTAALYAMIHFTTGWDAIGYLLLFIYGGIALAACLLIWIVYFAVRLIRR